jgi:MHS family proline/betaine transporter-like MFS transporter
VIRDLFTHHKSTIFKVVCVDLTVAVGFFLICVYIMTYLQNFVGFSYRFAATINTISMVAFAAVIPLAGRASDRWSPIQVMKTAVIGFIFLAIPLFYGLSSGVPLTAAVAQIGLSILMGINFAPISVLLVSLFPVHVRYSGVSIAHNLSMAIFGGSAPHIVTFLIKNTGNLLMPGIILTLAAVGSLWGLSAVRPSKDF